MTDTQPPPEGAPIPVGGKPAPHRAVAAVPPPVRSRPGDPPIFQQIAGPVPGGATARAGKDFLHGAPPPAETATHLWVIPSPPQPPRPLADFVSEEVEAAGITSRDQQFAQTLVATAAVFDAFFARCDYSLDAAVDLLTRLLRRQPLGPEPLPDGWEENSRTRSLRARLESAERLLQVVHRGNGELTRLLAIARQEHESQMRVRSALLGMVVGLARAHGVTGWIDEQGGEHPMDERVPAGQFAVGPQGQFIIGVDAEATLVKTDVVQAEEPGKVEANG